MAVRALVHHRDGTALRARGGRPDLGGLRFCLKGHVWRDLALLGHVVHLRRSSACNSTTQLRFFASQLAAQFVSLQLEPQLYNSTCGATHKSAVQVLRNYKSTRTCVALTRQPVAEQTR